MAAEPPQNFSNHARNDFLYLGGLLLLLVAFVLAGILVVRHPKLPAICATLAIVGTMMVALRVRTYALTVQDRVIRLEMRLRLDALLEAGLRERARALTMRQLVGLRFASDAELPALVAKVLDEKIEKSKDIKALVRDWQADHQRV